MYCNTYLWSSERRCYLAISTKSWQLMFIYNIIYLYIIISYVSLVDSFFQVFILASQLCRRLHLDDILVKIWTLKNSVRLKRLNDTFLQLCTYNSKKATAVMSSKLRYKVMSEAGKQHYRNSVSELLNWNWSVWMLQSRWSDLRLLIGGVVDM